MIFIVVGLAWVLFWPLALYWQARQHRRHAITTSLPPIAREVMDTLNPSGDPVRVWLSSDLSKANGGATLIGGSIVLPADVAELDSFLGDILAHEWGHRVRRHNTTTIAYMTLLGLAISAIGYVSLMDHNLLWHITFLLYTLAALGVYPLSRRMESAADAYVARHYPQWIPALLEYFHTLSDKHGFWTVFFDTHPQPSRRIQALQQLMQ